MATFSDKLENCEVCGGNKAKYTCPKCEVRTCCLQCVNIHKKELECDGIRDKTKFIPLRSFTDLDVLSDYRLLEEVGRTVEQLKRDPLKKCTRQLNLPMHLNKLKTATFKRNVNLQFMPQHFSRHKNNTTYLNWKTSELFWRIEWIFPQAECTKWVTERALESTRLSLLIEEILDPTKSVENKNDIEELNLRIRLNERLQFYQAAGLSGIKILLKAEKVVKSDLKFYELDVRLSLKENLENKTIIEFPTLYIILNDHSHMYEIIDTDDEDANASKYKYNHNASRKRKRAYNQRNMKEKTNSTVNYFFNSEFSGSDEERSNNDRGSKCLSNSNIPDYDELIRM
ncbi:box C/D snoRNA protein 1 [Bombus vancouverensis nearcticus]|uniref:box C/D snoRNA protein 1 n=1 Tax=Bombus vancouverensis nearcticus TaxID=2705178 RepID=UPI00143A40E7|nr:box C/D snoRNA protein 1 [Bombus vancouverensis nearcticus]